MYERTISKFFMTVILCMMLAFVGSNIVSYSTINVYAEDLDDLGENGGSDTYNDDTGVANFLKGNRAMNAEQLETASEKLSPFTNVIGYIIGGIISIVSVGIFLITAIDLLYIGIPFLRTFLYTPNTDGTGAMTGGRMGGYGMGRYGGMGGMAQQPVKRRQWVSDEAVQCAALMGGSAATANQGGYGGVYGGYGGMGGMAQQNPAEAEGMTTKSVILVYFKKRAFFIIIFTISTILLTSSLFVGTGVNLAQWIAKLIGMLNNSIPK